MTAFSSGYRTVAWPEGLDTALPNAGWVVLRCSARHEKRVTSGLRLANLSHLLFLERRKHTYSRGRKEETEVPLLGGYVFAIIPQGKTVEIFYRVSGVVGLMEVKDQGTFREELATLCRMVANQPTNLVVLPELQPGRTVRVISGVFAGCKGIIACRNKVWSLIVNLPLLGGSIASEINVDCLELDESDEKG
jgi:transcription antitermination factor NusG